MTLRCLKAHKLTEPDFLKKHLVLGKKLKNTTKIGCFGFSKKVSSLMCDDAP